MTNPQPGWYRDPSNSSQLRWWDGSQWTSYTQAANGATSGMSPAGRVTTSSSAYSAVPAHPSASTTGSAQAQYPSAQASSAQPQAPFAQARPSSAPAQAPLAQTRPSSAPTQAPLAQSQAPLAQPQAPFAQARPASAPAQAPLAQPQAPFAQARPASAPATHMPSAQPQPRYTGAPQASVPGAPQAGYSAAPTRPSYASAPQPAYGSSSTSSFPGAPAAPMAPARPAKPAKPKKPSAWTGKQKFLTVMYVLLTVAFTVSGFALMNSAQHNQDRASILDAQIQPLRQSVAEQQKKLDALNKQLEGSGK